MITHIQNIAQKLQYRLFLIKCSCCHYMKESQQAVRSINSICSPWVVVCYHPLSRLRSTCRVVHSGSTQTTPLALPPAGGVHQVLVERRSCVQQKTAWGKCVVLLVLLLWSTSGANTCTFKIRVWCNEILQSDWSEQVSVSRLNLPRGLLCSW